MLEELSSNFKFNDAVIRNMILQRKSAITESSSILSEDENNKKEELEKKTDVVSDDTKHVESGVENV